MLMCSRMLIHIKNFSAGRLSFMKFLTIKTRCSFLDHQQRIVVHQWSLSHSLIHPKKAQSQNKQDRFLHYLYFFLSKKIPDTVGKNRASKRKFSLVYAIG